MDEGIFEDGGTLDYHGPESLLPSVKSISWKSVRVTIRCDHCYTQSIIETSWPEILKQAYLGPDVTLKKNYWGHMVEYDEVTVFPEDITISTVCLSCGCIVSGAFLPHELSGVELALLAKLGVGAVRKAGEGHKRAARALMNAPRRLSPSMLWNDFMESLASRIAVRVKDREPRYRAHY